MLDRPVIYRRATEQHPVNGVLEPFRCENDPLEAGIHPALFFSPAIHFRPG
jgi:hypothetical protein